HGTRRRPDRDALQRSDQGHPASAGRQQPGRVQGRDGGQVPGPGAPAVIYSMAASSADEAPRGLDFLYDPHRLNVATSRARALAIIVASPDLIRVSCRTRTKWSWRTPCARPGRRAADSGVAMLE